MLKVGDSTAVGALPMIPLILFVLETVSAAETLDLRERVEGPGSALGV